jgi:proteasome accessory factor C
MSPRTLDDASAQLRRLMHVIPALGDEKPHRISEIAAIVGVSEDVIARDLRTLVTRYDDEPGGFIEGVQLAFGADAVRLRSQLFRRPMGLSPAELAALELGLGALYHESPPDDAKVIKKVREQIAKAAPGLAVAERLPVAHAVAVASDVGEYLGVLRKAVDAGCKTRLAYRSGSATVATERTVHPYGLVSVKGKWYLIAFCDKASGIRIFRLDRVASVTVLDEPAAIPDRLKIEEQLRHGRALVSHTDEQMRVRYSAHIARWITEHEEVERRDDGSVVVTYPLLDDDWAVRHVLGYGPDAEVLEPTRIRDLVKSRLAELLATT